MAKLGLIPIIAASVGVSGVLIGIDKLRDKATTAAYDNATNTLTLDIGHGDTEATITAFWDVIERKWETMFVVANGNMNSTTAARINRLMTGTMADTLQTYHRTGSIVIRSRNNPVALPAEMRVNNGTQGWELAYSQALTPVPAPVAPPVAPAVLPSAPVVPVAVVRSAAMTAPAPVLAPVATTLKAPTVNTDPSGLLTFPARATTTRIITDPQTRTVLDMYWDKHIAGSQSIIALVGPSGTGKTSIIRDMAADKKVGMFTFDAAGAASFSDWTGTTVLKNGEDGVTTDFVLSTFLQVIRSDGAYGDDPRIVLVDEVNRAESGGALNALMPILSQNELFVPELGKTIPVSHSVFFAFTMNRGSAYNATLSLDAALQDRIQACILLDFLKASEEEKLLVDMKGINRSQANDIVKVARQIREVADRGELTHSISTRRTLDAAEAVSYGLTVKQAAEYCWANAYLDEGGTEGDRGIVMTAVNASLV